MTTSKRPRDTNQLAKMIVDPNRLWETKDLAKLVENAEGPVEKRGPYNKRAVNDGHK